MPLKHEHFDAPMRLSDVLLVEVNNDWCRQTVNLAPCELPLPVGAVLARRVDGDYAPYMLTAADTDVAAMLVTPAEADAGRQDVVVVRRGCVVAAANLHFISAVTADQKKVALALMDEIGLVPQE